MTHPLRDLTYEEKVRHPHDGYVKFEAYPESELPRTGRFWTQQQLDDVGGGCYAVTTMARPLAETIARDLGFYGSTFCATCGKYLPIGERGEFVWLDDGTRVGT